jgi:predicted lipid-binding transport protein (Tim44 family)
VIDRAKEMTAGMKVMALAIFVSICGLFFGLAGLFFDWQLAKTIGIVSAAALAAIFWLSAEVKNKTLDHFLTGRKRQD